MFFLLSSSASWVWGGVSLDLKRIKGSTGSCHKRPTSQARITAWLKPLQRSLLGWSGTGIMISKDCPVKNSVQPCAINRPKGLPRETLRPYLKRCFFQAEDGIRDDLVTGVQTCALPI